MVSSLQISYFYGTTADLQDILKCNKSKNSFTFSPEYFEKCAMKMELMNIFVSNLN